VQGVGLPVPSALKGAAALASIDARPLMFAFAICGGAATYFSMPFEPDLALLAGASALTLAVWIAARLWWTSDTAITLVVVALGLSMGLLAGSLRTRLVEAPVVSIETGPAMVEGWVQEVEPGRKGVRLVIRVHSIAGMSAEDWPEYIRVTHTSRLEVAPGRFVRCWSVLRPPPGPAMPGEYDFRRQAWFEKLGAVGYVQGRCRGGTLGAPADAVDRAALALGAARRNLALKVDAAAGERAGGFAAALVSGDRSFMRLEDAEALRDTGLAHLLAISGLHLSIVGGLVFLLVKRTLVLFEPLALRVAVQKPAAVIALLACLAYLIVSGASVATQRAFIMAAIVFGAVIFDRSAISLRTFAIAMIAVVLLQPESVVTPGFQMSFAATGALIAAYELWRNRRAGEERVLGPVAFSWASIALTSLVAGLATMPYALFHFDRAAPIGFVANLVAMPVVTFLSAPSAAVAFILAPFGYSEIGLRLFGYSLELVLAVAHFFSRFSEQAGASDRSMPATSLLLATAALAAFIALRGTLRFTVTVALAAACLVVWGLTPRFVAHWSSSGDLFVAKPAGGIERLALAKGNSLAPLRFANAAEATCNEADCEFLTPSGVSVKITKGLDPTICLTLAGDEHDTSCLPDGGSRRLKWTWTETAASGGQTVYLDGQTLRVMTTPQCGARPWHPCPAPGASRAP
jgi:competence protein ComEC